MVIVKFSHRNEHITAATTALPLLIGSAKAMEKTIVVTQRFLVRFGMRTPPPKNLSFDSGSVHVVPSGKNNGVVCADVMRYWAG
jgi:hypothetical protein